MLDSGKRKAGHRFNVGHDPHRSNSWLIYFRDIHCGSVSHAVGLPWAAQRWARFCSFYPGSEPGEQAHGTADKFDQARADFDKAWRVFLSRQIERDFEEWARPTRRKYEARDRGQVVQLR